MYQRPNAPRSIGGVLDDAIRLYRESFKIVWPVLLVATLLAIIPGILFALNGAYSKTPAEQMQAFTQMFTSPTYWVTLVVVSLLNLIMYGALFSAIDAVAQGGELGLAGAFKVGVARLPKMFAASFLLGLALIVGFVLLLIPGIYLFGIFQLVFVAIVIENAGPMAAFGVSRRLIKGHWWRSTTIVTVALVILIVLSMLVGLVAGTLGVLKASIANVMVTNQILSAVLDIFILGWFPCVLLSMYYDLKLRHEGSDLATRVSALA